MIEIAAKEMYNNTRMKEINYVFLPRVRQEERYEYQSGRTKECI